MKTLKAVGYVIGLLLLIGTGHEMTYQDEIAEEEFYCDMIAKGFYSETFRPERDCYEYIQENKQTSKPSKPSS